jgi:hypothetical protein
MYECQPGTNSCCNYCCISWRALTSFPSHANQESWPETNGRKSIDDKNAPILLFRATRHRSYLAAAGHEYRSVLDLSFCFCLNRCTDVYVCVWAVVDVTEMGRKREGMGFWSAFVERKERIERWGWKRWTWAVGWWSWGWQNIDQVTDVSLASHQSCGVSFHVFREIGVRIDTFVYSLC